MPDQLGDKTLEELGLALSIDYQHPGPETRDYTMEIEGMAGAWDFGADIGARPFSLPCVLIEDSPVGLQRAIRAITAHLFDPYGKPKLMKLIWEEEPDRYYNVRYSGSLPINRVLKNGTFTLPLTAFDPYAYSLVDSSTITWGSQRVTFQALYPFGLTGTGAAKAINHAQQIDIYNDGYVARPTFVLNGSATHGVTLSANSKSFSLSAFTGQVVVDGHAHTVSKDGTNFISSFTGDFIDILPGTNVLQIAGSSLNFDLTVKFPFNYL